MVATDRPRSLTLRPQLFDRCFVGGALPQQPGRRQYTTWHLWAHRYAGGMITPVDNAKNVHGIAFRIEGDGNAPE